MQVFIGTICTFAFNFAPSQWALCAGQTLSISQNAALFSLLGTYYGGNGTSTFQLPDLQGRAVYGQGNGLGLTPRVIGDKLGAETVALSVANLPAHNHLINAVSAVGDKGTPSATVLAAVPTGLGKTEPYSDATPNTTMNPAMVATTGGGQAFGIIGPGLVLNYAIALYGIFPSRS